MRKALVSSRLTMVGKMFFVMSQASWMERAACRRVMMSASRSSMTSARVRIVLTRWRGRVVAVAVDPATGVVHVVVEEVVAGRVVAKARLEIGSVPPVGRMCSLRRMNASLVGSPSLAEAEGVVEMPVAVVVVVVAGMTAAIAVAAVKCLQGLK